MTVCRVGDSRRASYKRISVMGLMFWMYFPQMLNKRCCCKFGSGNGFVLFDPIKITLLTGFSVGNSGRSCYKGIAPTGLMFGSHSPRML
jgi:hypothetical protein